MKIEVTLYCGGKVWKETVEANNVPDGRKAIAVRNPQAKVIGANPVFK